MATPFKEGGAGKVDARGASVGDVLTINARIEPEWAAPAAGGGGSQTLAQTLALGADAGGVKITGLQDPAAAQDAATRAYVLAQIALLVNSAPGALDTLKELADAIGDDANYAATITTALAGKQPLDSDLTAIAAVATTSFGRSLLALANAAALGATVTLDQIAAAAANVALNSKKITGLANGTAAQDAAAFGQIPTGANGQTGIIVPTAPGWVTINQALTANRAYASRFTVPVAQTVTSMRFRTITAGTGNVDVGILDSTGARLASSGSTSGKKGATTTQSVTLSAPLALTAGTVYYAVIESDTGDGSFMAAWFTTNAVGLEQLFGTTIGLVEGYIKDTTFPIPSSVVLGSLTGASGPVFGFA